MVFIMDFCKEEFMLKYLGINFGQGVVILFDIRLSRYEYYILIQI